MRASRNLSILASVALLAGFAAGQASQASELVVTHRSGQTFLTWREATVTPAPDTYHVYRAVAPILAAHDLARATLVARVPQGSWLNARVGAGVGYRLIDLGPALKAGDGLAVLTATENRAWYYAVVAVTNKVENVTIDTGAKGNTSPPVRDTVAPLRPVLQSVKDGKDYHYVHFVPAVTTSAVEAQTNREGWALNYRVYYDKTTSGPRPVYVILHQRAGSYKQGVQGWAPANAVQVFLDDDNPPSLHSVWFGHHEDFGKGSPRGTVHNYTERRLLWTLEQVLADTTIQADRNRVYSFGGSFGAMGALAMGVRYPDIFAAVGGLVPAFGLTHSDFTLKNETDVLFGTVQQNLPTSLAEKVYDLFDYAAQVAKYDGRGVAPMLFTVGRGDSVTGWSDKPDFFRASYRSRQPIAFYWDLRTHASTGQWSLLEQRLFQEISDIRLDRPLPAFTNLSLDEDPGDGNRLKGDLVGTMGGYVTFDPKSASETSSKVTFDVGLKTDPTRLDYAKQPYGTVDLSWRRLRKFQTQPGSYFRIRSRKKGQTQIEEERIAVPDAKGLVTVRKLGVERGLRTVELEPYTPNLPEVHFGGETRVGGTIAVALVAPKNQFALLTVGAIEGQINTPFGVWRIMDPIFLWGGITPPSGLLEDVIPLPPDPRFRGVRILGQAMVFTALTPLARVTFR